MQHEVSCDVLVHMRPEGFEPRFTEGFVFNAPPALPDGEYAVHFESNTMLARKKNGRWLYSNHIDGPTMSEAIKKSQTSATLTQTRASMSPPAADT